MPEIFELLNNFLKICINKIDNTNISECGVPNYLELLDDNQLRCVYKFVIVFFFLYNFCLKVLINFYSLPLL